MDPEISLAFIRGFAAGLMAYSIWYFIVWPAGVARRWLSKALDG